MAISFVTSGEAGAANGGNPAITPGATPAANDLILVVSAIGDNDNVNVAMAMTTAGYTLVPGTELFINSGAGERDCNFACFYKFANGSENAATTLLVIGTDASCVAVAQVFRGVDITTPFDVANDRHRNRLVHAEPTLHQLEHDRDVGRGSGCGCSPFRLRRP